MSDSTSIVLIHRGYDWYLYYSLNQIRSLRAGSPLVLLGDDKATKAFPGINGIDVAALFSGKVKEFVDSYVHMSTNPYDFELFCFLRWFYLLEFMKSEGIGKAFYIDSDVLLYSPLEDIFAVYEGRLSHCGFMVPHQEHDSLTWAGTGGTSFWRCEALDEFCRFLAASYRNGEIFSLYRKKWEHHKTNRIGGGVCDMTTFYFFWMRESRHITNLSEIVQDHAFDANINTSANYSRNEFKMEGPFKRIRFRDGKPFGETAVRDREVRFHTLHFQGPAKWSIPKFYTGRPFRRRFLHELSWYGTMSREALRKVRHLTVGKGPSG